MSALLLLQIVGAVVAVVVALSGIAAMLWAVSKVKGVEVSLGLLDTANDGLRKVVTDLQAEKARDREHFTLQLHQQEKDCASAIAKLEGVVATLTGGLADKIIAAVSAGDAQKNAAINERLTRVEYQIDHQHLGDT